MLGRLNNQPVTDRPEKAPFKRFQGPENRIVFFYCKGASEGRMLAVLGEIKFKHKLYLSELLAELS